ncbi:DUF3617 domain-containing protein [Rhodoplanes sp. Z2-YC6860]|uniref:DUF3617 domain-containing protein n=1 Tax=Rhodoplanes sp. Z2-YC6860 TaxID=674703 RepID=UPI00078DF059|nr:DUF3617 family protein [Rhodoplanes sp. Z2-YC6860]AMN43484.1 hypothetical protein RHPLAN_50600 [Rhodoplanes sp. Z2-YC6860]
MSLLCRLLATAAIVCWASHAFADGIQPGLWKIISRMEANGAMSPPQQSSKCFTAEQARDLVKTFSPAPMTINSECGELESSLDGNRLKWRLVCTGQLNMEITGDYTFREGTQYAGIVRNTASMSGMPTSDSVTTLYAERVSDCP